MKSESNHLPCVQFSNNHNLQLNHQPSRYLYVESLIITSTTLQILSLVPDLLEKLTSQQGSRVFLILSRLKNF
ncbi:hypothetical protein P8452_33248 [Trifolium repens]|nr:hypothetical protein P8452_33248 [Trifolium repens]